LELQAEQLLSATPEVSAGEVVPAAREPNDITAWHIKNTLLDPDAVASEASERRVSRALEGDVLELALDAAESAGAKNSLEKMLCHQMAGAHDCSMKLLARAFDPKNPPAVVAQLANAAAKLMNAYQGGLMALQKMRTGGRQVVTVQHVSISGNAQAVVAGNIGRGRRNTGDGGKNNE
jgi:hypothetical protein